MNIYLCVYSHAKVNGDAATVRKFSHKFPQISESTVRGFRKKYSEALKARKLEKGKDCNIAEDNVKTLESGGCSGRPLKLGKLDVDVQRRLKIIRESGGRVDTQLAISVAKAVVQVKGSSSRIGDIDRGWARSLFKRMGYSQRAATTGKLALPKLSLKRNDLRSCMTLPKL